MAIEVKPVFTLILPDDPASLAAGRVTPSRWNSGSYITMESGFVIGRTSPDAGAAQEIAITSLLSGLVQGAASSINGYVPLWDGVSGTVLSAGVGIGTNPNNLVQLDGDGKLPAIDASQLINLPLPGGTHNHDDLYYRSSVVDDLLALKANDLDLAAVAKSGLFSDLSDAPAIGTAAGSDIGTGPNNVVVLDASSRLPAVDASNLLNVPVTTHVHDADDLTSGVIALERLPVADSGVTSASSLVRADDPRLSDAREAQAHTHPISEVDDLATTLDGKAALVHNHDDLYYLRDDVDGIVSTKADKDAFAFSPIEPTLDVLFKDASGIPQDLNVLRNTIGTQVNNRGFIETVGVNAPRLDHDPISKVFKGVLIEEARTNLVSYSNDLSNGVWTKTSSYIQQNASLSPSGLADADKIVETLGVSGHFVSRSAITVETGKFYTLSFYAKAAERSVFNVLLSDGSAFYGRKFDLNTGESAVEDVDGAAPATLFGMETAGGGYFRCSVTVPMVATASGFQIRLHNGTDIYEGDDSSGLFVWGVQMEEGDFKTSLIPTSATALTRAQDVLSLSGNTTSDWFNPVEGSLFLDARTFVTHRVNRFPAIAQFDDGTANNRFRLYFRVLSLYTDVSLTIVTNGSSVASIQGNVQYVGPNKVFAYALNNFALGADNAFPGLDNLGAVPVNINRLLIGSGEGGAINGHIRRVIYWPSRLSNFILQQITRFQV